MSNFNFGSFIQYCLLLSKTSALQMQAIRRDVKNFTVFVNKHRHFVQGIIFGA